MRVTVQLSVTMNPPIKKGILFNRSFSLHLRESLLSSSTIPLEMTELRLQDSSIPLDFENKTLYPFLCRPRNQQVLSVKGLKVHHLDFDVSIATKLCYSRAKADTDRK